MDSPSHITSGIRKVLEVSWVYDAWQSIIGNHAAKIRYSRDYIKPKAHDKILDIGCGTGHILNYLPLTCEYVGYDLNEFYIRTAKKKYGTRASFFCSAVSDHSARNKGYFDIVMANALLHHLDNTEARHVFETAYESLKPGGYLITHDGVYTEKQNKIARWLLSKDRGQNVRITEGYLELAKTKFQKIEHYILHDIYRIPYSTIILKCFK